MFTLEQITHFWTHVDIQGPEDCWDWLGHINQDGDGIVELGSASYLAYRVAYHITYGINGLLGCRIIHTCENPSCCNPNHLCHDQAEWEPPPGVTV